MSTTNRVCLSRAIACIERNGSFNSCPVRRVIMNPTFLCNTACLKHCHAPCHVVVWVGRKLGRRHMNLHCMQNAELDVVDMALPLAAPSQEWAASIWTLGGCRPTPVLLTSGARPAAPCLLHGNLGRVALVVPGLLAGLFLPYPGWAFCAWWMDLSIQ